MKLIVSIVSFNTKNLLEKCLKSIYDQGYAKNLQLWVVDNASIDGSADMVKRKFSKINLIKNSKNLGFAGGHNIVLRKFLQADEEYILLLNPDLEMPSNSIEKLVKFMDQNIDCGISSCKILDFQGNLQSNGGDLPLGFGLISWLFNLEFLFNSPNYHRKDKNYYKYAHEVGWVGGTVMLIRKKVFEQVGLLDEKFFMYFEDVDYCFRAQKKGFKIMINPGVIIKHLGGASSKDPKFRQWSGEFNGLIYFYRKNFGVLAQTIVRALIFFAIILRIIIFTFLGKLEISKAYAKVLFAI